MAHKKTYIYHAIIGNNDVTDVDVFVLARNLAVAVSFLQEEYKDKKYNSYRLIKVGESSLLEETQIISEEKAYALRRAGAAEGTFYREISPKGS